MGHKIKNTIDVVNELLKNFVSFSFNHSLKQSESSSIFLLPNGAPRQNMTYAAW